MKGNDSTVQGKTKHTKPYRKIMQPKKHKKIKPKVQPGCMKCFC